MKKTIFLILSLILISQTSKSNFLAGDLTYKCIGGNDYQINFTFYKLQYDSLPPDSVLIQFQCSSNSSYNFTKNIGKIWGTGLDVSMDFDTTYNHIYKYEYQGEVTLLPCNHWTISCSGLSRINASPISNGLNTAWYKMAMLNNLDAPGNSSPKANNDPILYSFIDKFNCYNHGIIDINADSLDFSFFCPFANDENTCINYYFPYSYQNFIQSSIPISIDNVTGDICLNTVNQMQSVLGVKIKEYRNLNGVPVLIGITYRDIYIKSILIENSIPVLSGMDFTNSHTYSSNDTIHFKTYPYTQNLNISFDLNGHDDDSTKSPGNNCNPPSGYRNYFTITWNNGIPNATFQHYFNASDSAYAHFEWNPTPVDFNSIPKCFTSTIQDFACPYSAYQTFMYCITLLSNPNAIEENNSLSNFEIYPNPAKDVLNLDLKLLNSHEIKIEMLDICGKKIIEKEYGNLPAGNTSIEISLINLPSGFYICSLIAGKEKNSKKLVIR